MAVDDLPPQQFPRETRSTGPGTGPSGAGSGQTGPGTGPAGPNRSWGLVLTGARNCPAEAVAGWRRGARSTTRSDRAHDRTSPVQTGPATGPRPSELSEHTVYHPVGTGPGAGRRRAGRCQGRSDRVTDRPSAEQLFFILNRKCSRTPIDMKPILLER